MIGRIIGWLRGHRRSDGATGSGSGSGSEPEMESEDADADPGSAPVVVAITDELDLHHFAPKEVGDLVTEYLDAAQAEGLTTVRIIHGKGIGALRRTVHAVLARHPAVLSHRPGGEREGGWGATIVTLRARS